MLLLIQLGSHNVANLVFDRSGCSLLLSVTDHIGREGNAIGRVHLFLLCLLSQLTLCVWVTN